MSSDKKSFAISYGMKKKSKGGSVDCMAEGGDVNADENLGMPPPDDHSKQIQSTDSDNSDMVANILTKMAKGGEVGDGNDDDASWDDLADSDSANFDYGVAHGTPKAPAKDTGNEIGDDIVARAMKKRGAK